MLTDDILPDRLLRSVWRGWHWILLGGVLGGLLGWGLTFLRTPRYESSAELSIGFDYARVNAMDDTVTNYIALRVRDLLLSDETGEGALKILNGSTTASDLPVTLEDLRGRIQLAQDSSRWVIVGRARTPEDAAAIANAWADSSLQALGQAMQHAIRAADLQTAIYRAGCKLVEDPASPGQAIYSCETPGESVSDGGLPAALITEAGLSRGLLPAMSFSLLRRAEAPTAPVLWGRGGLIVAGVLLGMWLAVLIVLVRSGQSPARLSPDGLPHEGAG
jgi:uncharacterized protein involved in exopolysaccharide biosynthesis